MESVSTALFFGSVASFSMCLFLFIAFALIGAFVDKRRLTRFEEVTNRIWFFFYAAGIVLMIPMLTTFALSQAIGWIQNAFS